MSGDGDRPTRVRLLESATRVFAEKGYRGATIAEICEDAGANIAAVNYHFGDKQHLYSAVWRAGLDLAGERYPLNGGLNGGASPRERLGAFIAAMLRRTLDAGPTAALGRLLVLEMVEPTSVLDEMMDVFIQPTARYLDEILRAIVPEANTEKRLRLCRLSVVSQCVFLNFTRSVRERIMGRPELSDDEIEELARHMTRFSMAGLRDVRRNWQREDAAAS